MKVSLFNNVRDKTPKVVDLDLWLKTTIDPPKKLKNKVDKYRELVDKEIKLSLPCITPCARFKGIRNLESVKSLSGFIVFDIDRESKAKNKPSNSCIDMLRVKELLKKEPFVYYCGFSVSGDGLYVVVKIDQKKSFSKYFKYFEKWFFLKGIFIDEVCKDLTRLRIFSYDKKAYYNPNSDVFKLPKKIKKEVKVVSRNARKSDVDKVESLIATIERNAIDVTSGYNDWIKIGASFYNLLGDRGLAYFDRVSKFHPDYSSEKVERKFNSCKRLNGTGIGSFFYICDSYGIRF
jgi:hypothetical protein